MGVQAFVNHQYFGLPATSRNPARSSMFQTDARLIDFGTSFVARRLGDVGDKMFDRLLTTGFPTFTRYRYSFQSLYNVLPPILKA